MTLDPGPSTLDPGPSRIGLALGAGGIRGCAHIGVLKVLVEEGVPIHCVAGASAGAVIGAGFAGGLSPREIEEAFLGLNLGEYLRFYLDRLRIRRTSAIGRTILDLGGAIRLEELPKPCAIVAVDLYRKERVVLTEGPAIEAVKAAIAIPFISGPARLRGRRLYDGGLIDPLPVDLPREMGAEKVIAVDVGRPFASPPLALLGGALKVVPGLREMGNLLDLMGQATTYSHPVPPDLILRPDLQGMGPNSIRRASINRAIAQGEACARAALPAIRSLAKSD